MQKSLLAVLVGALLGAGGLYGLVRFELFPGLLAPHREGEHAEEEHGEHEGEHLEAERRFVQLAPKAVETAKIRAEEIRLQSLAGGLSVTGNVRADQNRLAHISPRISGRIVRVRGDLGKHVEQDEVLVELDSVDLGMAKADYLRLKGLLEVAKANHDREKGLHERGTSSEKDMLDARAAFLTAQAEFNAAREKLLLFGLTQSEVDALSWEHEKPISHFPLRAPFAGRVIEKHATVGEVVGPDRQLFTIADLSRVWILLDIYEKDLPRVKVGQSAEITGEGFAQSLRGRVTYVSDVLDEETRSAKARVEVENTDGRLRPGMFVRAILVDDGATRQALLVPESALQRMDSGFVIFVEIAPHRFERREVELGERQGDRVEVKSGVKPGERVVTEGGFWLKSEFSRAKLGEGHSH